MGRLVSLREFFEVPIRYAWLTLLVPSLFALKFIVGDFEPWPGPAGYARAWIMHFVPFACMVVPIQLSYAHLPARWRPSDPTSLRAVPFHAAVITGWGLVGFVVGGFLVSPLFPPAELDPTREWREIPGLAFVMTLVGAPIVMRGISYRERLAEMRNRELQAQREALAAQVQALQARIEPHFLFNSLNTVASLIGEDSARAERALEKVSAVFRYALEASREPFVPLAEELQAVEGFLELEKLRFPDRLETSLRVEPGVAGMPVPPLFLQPLVENAVRHGIAPREEPGRLALEIRHVGDELHVRVEDDGSGAGASSHRGAGAALADLRRRLELLYGDGAQLSVDRGELGGCRVLLRLPTHAPARAGSEGPG